MKWHELDISYFIISFSKKAPGQALGLNVLSGVGKKITKELHLSENIDNTYWNVPHLVEVEVSSQKSCYFKNVLSYYKKKKIKKSLF